MNTGRNNHGDTFNNHSEHPPSRSIPFPSRLPQSTHPPSVTRPGNDSRFGNLPGSSITPLPQDYVRTGILDGPRLALAPATRFTARSPDTQRTHPSGLPRVKQACEPCRRRRVKCDGQRPHCSHCSDNQLQCAYRRGAIQKFVPDRSTQRLLDRVDQLEKNWLFRQDSLERTLMQQQKAFSDWLSPNKPSISATDSDIQVTNTPYCGQEDPIQDGSEGELAIPIGHTTAAHNLLSWPSVQSLIHPLKRSGEYVMELEANRGLITAYDEDGVGNPSDDSQVLVPPATENGRLDIELSGRFNANSSTTQRYYQSYLSNIHKVHPFLDQTELSMQVDDFTQYYCSENFSSQIQPRVEGTIYNAIILLVLAIGAFCDQPSPLTFPSTDTPIAGLSLYGFAVSTLGPSQGGTNLKHAQACLLAGIYIGQFAHPFQSYSWISQASWVCQLLIRPKRYRILHSSVKDLCRFIYWTCLKLESNILAELDLPPSGLSRFESQIDLPTEKSALTDSPDSPLISTMLFYSAHIHLRKILNRVHTELYKFDHEEQGWSLTVQQALSMNLARWRASLPYMMKWGDDEQPATEINTARMRAKFYGAQYIIYRPLLYRALHSPPGAKEGLPQPLLDACKICIKSAILNTMAFDRIEGRLIITNIFGTAHGQFGNMLVLSATYMSNLRELVDRDLLQRLLEGTIRFLQHTGSGSPSLQADMEILTEIYGKIFTPSIGS